MNWTEEIVECELEEGFSAPESHAAGESERILCDFEREVRKG